MFFIIINFNKNNYFIIFKYKFIVDNEKNILIKPIVI